MNRRHPIISRAWLSASKRTAEAKVQKLVCVKFVFTAAGLRREEAIDIRPVLLLYSAW